MIKKQGCITAGHKGQTATFNKVMKDRKGWECRGR
jgi:hypothetical protein